VAARHKHKMLVAYVGGAASEEDFEWMEWPTSSTRVRAPRRGEGRGTEKGDGEGGSCAGGVEESWWQLQFDNGVTIHVCVCVCVCVLADSNCYTKIPNSAVSCYKRNFSRARGRARAGPLALALFLSLSLAVALSRSLARSFDRSRALRCRAKDLALDALMTAPTITL
jgi:hypothetical protein